LIGVDLSKLGNPGDVVMLFECEPGENRVGGSEIASYPHSDGCNVAYADGHVKWYAKSMAEKVMARKPKIESKITSTRAPSD
jgi:prepilin-type processing-associated H-X9-DG protein